MDGKKEEREGEGGGGRGCTIACTLFIVPLILLYPTILHSAQYKTQSQVCESQKG